MVEGIVMVEMVMVEMVMVQMVMMMVMMEMVLVQMVMVMVQMVICVCSDGGGDAFQLCESQECGLLADPGAPRVIGPCWRDSCPPSMMMTMLI